MSDAADDAIILNSLFKIFCVVCLEGGSPLAPDEPIIPNTLIKDYFVIVCSRPVPKFHLLKILSL